MTSSAFAMETVSFDRDVRPILSNACFACHGPDEDAREADLRLDVKVGLDGRSEMGAPIVAPGDLDNSELFYRIAESDDGDEMPPKDYHIQLSDGEIDTIRRWIEGGATWQSHWAFNAPVKPEAPQPSDDGWSENEIDRFILAELERRDLEPAPPASKETLIRRLSLDLTGLPPTPDEVEAFLADTSAGAYEKLVDRLLASPRYGERMAWPWLDAARYADTNGYQGDNTRTMYPWRDWVVQSFNDNLPYDDFTVWQIAGDLLPEATFEQRLATGFNRNHMINGEGGRIAEENRVEYVFDQLETVGTVWMALTFNCARCHDHKYDPVSHEDYFRFFDFFNRTSVNGEGGNGQTPPILRVATDEADARIAEFDAEVRALSRELRDLGRDLEPGLAKWEETRRAEMAVKEIIEEPSDLDALLAIPEADLSKEQRDELKRTFLLADEDYKKLDRQIESRKNRRDRLEKGVPKVMIMEDVAEPRESYVLDRGIYTERRAVVSAGVPEAVFPMDERYPRNRLGLAQWLVDPEHPLTARVTVNRFWAEIFGQGLVKTPENFGVQGQMPSHPELLDWLAVTFIEHGWNVKKLLKMMVMSSSYRQSSVVTADKLETDPENIYLARAPRYRMPSWMLRDQALYAGGLLSLKQGGPSVKPYQPDGLWEEFSFGNIKYKQDSGESLYRRSLYTFWRRIVAPPMFFDASTRQTCTVTKSRTNTPLHALATLNEPGFVEAARAFGERLLTGPSTTDAERINEAFRITLGRPATDDEVELLSRSLERMRSQFTHDPAAANAYLAVGESPALEALDPPEHAAYAALCLVILNTDEALTKE